VDSTRLAFTGDTKRRMRARKTGMRENLRVMVYTGSGYAVDQIEVSFFRE
jgi:hypothetical protein